MLAASLALVLVPPLLLGWTDAAQAGLTAPTAITVAATTDNTGYDGAVPDVLAAVGSPIKVTVELQPAGAAFKKDTDLSLSPQDVVEGQPHGSFTPSTVTMPAGVSSKSFTVSYTAADNGVVLGVRVAANGKAADVSPGRTAPFDVLATLLSLSRGDPRFGSGVGVGSEGCTANTTEPECGIAVLPNDIESDRAALSLGSCTSDLGCTPGSQVVQFIAGLGTRYTPQDPATLIIRCDKRLCRNTNNGIKGFTLKVSQLATGPLDHVSQPCADKGVADNGLGNGDTFCTDYVQSHRDNSGDLLLYLLFIRDMRGST